MRYASMATKARKRLMRQDRGKGQDIYGPWVLPVVMSIDPAAQAFGRNFGFSDGSVLARNLRWRKCRDGRYHWVDAFSAHSL